MTVPEVFATDLRLFAQVCQPDGKRVWLCDSVPLPPNEWQHVAIVADGAVLRLYRNGMAVGTVSYRGIVRQSVPECLCVGTAMDKDGTTPRPGNAYSWNGRLDEIAIFNYGLSAEQVRQLYSEQATVPNRRTSP